MIDPERLFQLEPGQKRRKLALTFGELERDIAGIAEKGTEYNFTKMSRRDYTKAVCRIVLDDPKLPAPEREQLSSIMSGSFSQSSSITDFSRGFSQCLQRKNSKFSSPVRNKLDTSDLFHKCGPYHFLGACLTTTRRSK